MKKLFLIPFLLAPLFAEDKQPTIEERLQLMQAQRDFLLNTNQTLQLQVKVLQAQAQQTDSGNTLDQKAETVKVKYHCKSWNPDFTCIIETTEEQKPDKETK